MFDDEPIPDRKPEPPAEPIKWYKLVTWIGYQGDVANLVAADEDGIPALGKQIIGMEGIVYVDGLAVFAEDENRKAPMNGGNWSE
jgi:hypothetical protein